jgi:hypothetical protein
MFNKVYFLVNFHGIQSFLSIYKPDPSNLLILHSFDYLGEFVKSFVPENQIMVVPIQPYPNIKIKNRFVRKMSFFSQFFSQLVKYRFIDISCISEDAEVFFFGKLEILNFGTIMYRLRRKKHATLRYINAHKDVFNYERCKTVSFKNRMFTSIYKILTGVEWVYFKVHWGTCIGFAENFEETSHQILPWQEIANKYGLNDKNDKKTQINDVLIIDGPIQSFQEICVQESQSNLVKYFIKLLEKGKNIHLKLHPSPMNWKWSEYGSFSGTVLEKKIKLLQTPIPSELLMYKYSEIYNFTSTSVASPVDGTAYSLVNLLIFTSEEGKAKVQNLAMISAGNEKDNIVFVGKETIE